MPVQDIRSAANHKQTVLIIDDQYTILQIHTAIVKQINANLKVLSFSNPIDAISWLNKKRADVIITDYKMENMNGVEFAKALKLTNFGRNTPTIVITVINDYKIKRQLLSIGVDSIFKKPVDINQLISVVSELLEKQREKYNNSLPKE